MNRWAGGPQIRRRLVSAVGVLAVIAPGCGYDSTLARRSDGGATASTTTSTVLNLASTQRTPPTASSKVIASTSTISDGTVQVPQLRGVQSDQAVVVVAGSSTQTTANLTTYERVGSRWRVVVGPLAARVGRGGIAPPATKREGDLRTPSGTFGFGFAFGVQPDPGVKLPFRQITSTNIVWDDDPSSPLYNQWVDKSEQVVGTKPEPMYKRPAYDLGAVIAYNVERTPGVGSAIFLHTSTGNATAGCVSLPEPELRSILLWLDPTESPVIAIGVA